MALSNMPNISMVEGLSKRMGRYVINYQLRLSRFPFSSYHFFPRYIQLRGRSATFLVVVVLQSTNFSEEFETLMENCIKSNHKHHHWDVYLLLAH